MTFIIRKGLFFVTVIFIAASAALAAGPAETPVPKEAAVLARIGDWVFTEDDFNARLQGFPEAFRKIFEDPVQRRSYVERVVRSEAFARAAREEKLEETEEGRVKLVEADSGDLAQAYLQRICPPPPEPTPEEVEAYYRSHGEEFRGTDTVRARHILIKVPDGAGEDAVTEALEKATKVRKKAVEGESFWKLAREFSDDEGTKFRGGDLGYFSREKMMKPIPAAAFSMKKGETSDPVRSTKGFHIIQIEDWRAGDIKDFAAVAPRIRGRLIQEKKNACMDKAFERLKEKYGIEILP